MTRTAAWLCAAAVFLLMQRDAFVPARYPPLAIGSAVVLLEVRLDTLGSIADVDVVRSAPGFDGAARAAVRQWTFRPASVRGSAVPSRLYVVVGFSTPIGIGVLTEGKDQIS